MFENYTYENLLNDVLENAPEGIDTRQGSIFYDAVSGALLKVSMLFAELETLANLIYIDTTGGEYLDRKASEHSITRLAATSSKYYVTFDGVTPTVGERFYTDGMYFILQKTEDNTYYLEAELPGAFTNAVYNGTPAVPVNNIQGLNAATFGAQKEAGTDEESDDDLRERLRDKISGPAENGNRQHYRTWCEQDSGVGRARIIPLWDGPNTVKGVLIAPDGTPVGADVIARVQAYIDPDEDEDGEGDGLGEGVANIGAHFTAVAATETAVNVTLNSVVLAAGVTEEEATAAVEEAVTDYLKDLALNTADSEDVVVRHTAVSAIINALTEITDFQLLINNATDNITPAKTAVAVLGEVTVNVLQ